MKLVISGLGDLLQGMKLLEQKQTKRGWKCYLTVDAEGFQSAKDVLRACGKGLHLTIQEARDLLAGRQAFKVSVKLKKLKKKLE